MSYCKRLVEPQLSSWEEADVGCEVKSGISTMAERTHPSAAVRCVRRQVQLPVSVFAELPKKTHATEHARVFVCSL